MALIGVSVAVHRGNAVHPGTAPGYIAFGSILAAAFVFMIVGQLRRSDAITALASKQTAGGCGSTA
jgi:hypothetical protein